MMGRPSSSSGSPALTEVLSPCVASTASTPIE